MTNKIVIATPDKPSLSIAILAVLVSRPPTARRCSLPGCEVMTTHNGGYCCADHCREHRQRQRTSNVAHDGRRKETL